MVDAPPRAARGRDVTVPLLDRIIDEALDQDYQRAAERRSHAAAVPSGRRAALAVVAVFGVLVGTAAVESARTARDSVGERSSLLAQIESRRDRLTDQQQALTELRGAARAMESELDTLDAQAERAADDLVDLALPAGFSKIRGPGLRIVVQDARDAVDARVVRADDLSVLVDGLWNAGAEAIAINDQRITAVTSLRNSGLSIGVNRVSLRAPYIVRAIGDPDTLEADLLDSTSGLTWRALVEQLGFRVEVQTVDDMSLPAAQLRPLLLAEIADEQASDRSQEKAS